MKDMREWSPARKFLTDMAILTGMSFGLGFVIGLVIAAVIGLVKLFL